MRAVVRSESAHLYRALIYICSLSRPLISVEIVMVITIFITASQKNLPWARLKLTFGLFITPRGMSFCSLLLPSSPFLTAPSPF